MLARSMLLVLAFAVSGCMSDGDDDGFSMHMDWQDDSHARMTVRNMGDHDMDMQQAMAGMTMMGPNGTVPMFLGGMNGTALCRTGDSQDCEMGMHAGMGRMHADGNMLGPGDEWTYSMHAGRFDGTWGMMVTPGDMGMMHDGGHMA